MSLNCLYSNSTITKLSIKINYQIPNIKLNPYPYSDYQKLLIDKIKLLREEGYSHRKISKIFNERKILSYRGKKFSCGLVWEIEKKYNLHLKKNKRVKGEIVEWSYVVE